MKKIATAFLFLLISTCSIAQKKEIPKLEVLTSGTKTSLRGLSVVSDAIAWVSGSNGAVGKTTDGGKNWKWVVVKGFEKNDFRDIEAFDATTAL
ncbi:MAG: WD40/YVTN/BNR-like repeat-containing protein, partial [Flavisolibacter sp.]